MKRAEKERLEAKERLLGWLKPGDTIYTVLRHVSSSGMTRDIGLVLLQPDGSRLVDLHPNHAAATLLGYPLAKRGDGVRVGGCGMDMGFHVVSNLSAMLFPDGFGCIGEGCPSNDHSNGDRDYTPHMANADRIGADGKECPCHREHWHKSGDYALRHRWL